MALSDGIADAIMKCEEELNKVFDHYKVKSPHRAKYMKKLRQLKLEGLGFPWTEDEYQEWLNTPSLLDSISEVIDNCENIDEYEKALNEVLDRYKMNSSHKTDLIAEMKQRVSGIGAPWTIEDHREWFNSILS